jgi:hypothetical protein
MRLDVTHRLLLITTLFITGGANLNAEVFKGFPDMIVCKAGQTDNSPGELVFYVEGFGESGTAYYKNIGRQTSSLKISKDGMVKAEMAMVNDCIDQSLQQLKKQGRTLNFTR